MVWYKWGNEKKKKKKRKKRTIALLKVSDNFFSEHDGKSITYLD